MAITPGEVLHSWRNKATEHAQPLKSLPHFYAPCWEVELFIETFPLIIIKAVTCEHPFLFSVLICPEKSPFTDSPLNLKVEIVIIISLINNTKDDKDVLLSLNKTKKELDLFWKCHR